MYVLRVVILFLAGGWLLSALAGCDVLDAEPFEREVVVESYQVAGEPLKRVRLTWSVPIDEAYDPAKQAISGASVRVIELDDSGGTAAVHPYREVEHRSGIYIPEDSREVTAGRTYRLEVEIEEQESMITAETTVPDTFDVVDAAKALVYEDPDARVVITAPSASEREQGFVFTITAEDVRSDRLTPVFQRLYGDTENGSLETLKTTMSSVMGKDEYHGPAKGLIEIPFPWEAVPFFGPNRVEVAAIDKNYHDFLRTQSVQQGGVGFSPGEIPNVVTHVDGGTGLFGSYARKEFATDIRKVGSDASND